MEIATTTSTQHDKEKTEEVQPEKEQEKELTRSTSFTKRSDANDSNRISVNNNRSNNKSNSLPHLVTTSHPLLSSLHQINKLNKNEENKETKKKEEIFTLQRENNAKRQEEEQLEETLHTPPRLSAEYTEPSRESSVRKTEKKSRKDKDSGTKKSSTIVALKSLFGAKVAKTDEEKGNVDKDKNVKVRHKQSYRSISETSEKQAVQTLHSKIDVPCKVLEIEPTVRDTADASIDQIDQLLHHRFVAGLIPRELHGQPQPSSQSIEVASGKNVSENVNISNAFSATSSSMFNLFPSSDGVCHEAKSVSGSQVCIMPSVTRTISHSMSNELADSSVNGSRPSLRHVISLTDPRLRRTSRFLASQRDAAHNARQRAISWDGMRKTSERNSSMHAYTVGKEDGAPWKRSLPDLSHTGQILRSTKMRDEKAQNYVQEKPKDKSSLLIKEDQDADNELMSRLPLHWSPLRKVDSSNSTKPQNEKHYNLLIEQKEEQEEALSKHHRRHHGTESHDIDTNIDANDDKSATLSNSLCNECNIDTPKNESSRRYHRHHNHHCNHKLASSLSYSASSTLPTTIFASLISPNSLLQSPTSGTGNTDDESSQSKSNAINLAKVTKEKTKQKNIQNVSSPPQAKSIAVPDSTTKTKAVTSKTTSNANTIPPFTSTQTSHHQAETKSSNVKFQNESKLLSSLTGTLESAVNFAEEMRQERVAFTAEQRELIGKLKSYVNAGYEVKERVIITNEHVQSKEVTN